MNPALWLSSEALSERRLRDMREYLAIACAQEVAGDSELADAAGAVAANKLASAIRIDERVALSGRDVGQQQTRLSIPAARPTNERGVR